MAAQASVISLLPEARSRLNTLYMAARFDGSAGEVDDSELAIPAS